MTAITGITFINFAYCELEGVWQKISSDGKYDVEVYKSQDENCKISVRVFDEKKTKYHLKKGSQITIKGHVLIFNKEDFVQRRTYSLVVDEEEEL